MEKLEEAEFPVDFAFSIRITLESMKMSRLVDLKMSTNPSPDTTAHFGLLSMLESDLTVLADAMRTSESKLGNLTEFSLLMAKLNLCALGLNQATKVKTSEATQLRLSAFSCTTRLIQLFATTPLVSLQIDSTVTTSSLPVETYYPRAYWKGLGYACLVLLKLNLTKSLPKFEMAQSEHAIQQALVLFEACSIVDGDENQRAAKIIRILVQEDTREFLKPQCSVKSRMGASLMYEMVLSAVAWKKRKAAGQRKDLRDQPFDNNLIEASSQTDTPSPTLDISPQKIDEWTASSGYVVDGTGPTWLDMNFWDTSVFDQIGLDGEPTFVSSP
jgi:hypothetical protein